MTTLARTWIFSSSLFALGALAVACGQDAREPRPTAPSGVGGVGGAGGADPDSSVLPDDLLLDDFEDGDHLGLLDGSFWYTWADDGASGASVVTGTFDAGGDLLPEAPGAGGSGRALGVTFDLDKGEYEYEPFIGISLALGAVHDFASYEGLRYTYRGHSHEVRLETPAVSDHDYYAYQLPAASEWTTVEIWLEDFRQGGWGQEVELTLDQVQTVSFLVRGEAPVESGELWLDDLMLVGTMPRPTEPDLSILPADPPELVSLGDITIDTPLNQLALASLDKGYNITNWLEQERFEGFEYDEAFVEKLADAGFESLRLPIDLDRYVTATSPSLQIHEDLWTVLDSFDTWTATHGLSLTIDYHQYDEDFDPNDTEHVAMMAALWGAVAEHFAGGRDDVFLELLNEPELSAGINGGPTQSEWTAIAQSFIDAIRAEDATRPIIFGDVQWYDIDDLVNREPFEDDYIVYAFHFYDPFLFTHQGAGWANLAAAHELPYPYDPERWSEYYRDLGFSMLNNETWQLSLLDSYHRDATRNALYNRIAEVKQWAVTHQVPLVCNEFGVYDATSLTEDRVRYYDDLIGIFAELEIPWQIWFMVMDPESGEVDPDLAEALRLSP